MWRNMVETAGGRPILGTPYVGLLAEQILAETSTGADGPGLLPNDGLVDGKRYRLILQSAFGTDGVVRENGSFSVTAPASTSYLLYEDNLLVSSTPTPVTVGAPVSALTAAVAGMASITATAVGAVMASINSTSINPTVFQYGRAGPFTRVPSQEDQGVGLLGRYEKQSGEVIDYPVEFADWMKSRTGDSISTFSVAALPATDLVMLGQVQVGTTVTSVWAGGTPAVSYKITTTITTAAGLVKQAEFQLKIKEV